MEKESEPFNNSGKPLNRTALMIATILIISGVGGAYWWTSTRTSSIPPSGINTVDDAITDTTVKSNETFGSESVEVTNVTLSEIETNNATDTLSETSSPEDELNTTQPEIPEPDSAIITMNVSDLYDLIVKTYYRDSWEAKESIENLTGNVIRIVGFPRVSKGYTSKGSNETDTVLILFGTNEDGNHKDFVCYFPFTEEVVRVMKKYLSEETLVVEGTFYPEPPEIRFFAGTPYSIVGHLKNCRFVP